MPVPIDTQTPETAGWYLRILLEQLHNRRVGRLGGRRYRRDTVRSCHVRPGLELLEAYRRGDPPLREDIHSGWAAPFRQYVRMGRLNFAAKLVAPTANRMGLRGFRTAAVNDELGDVAAQEIMRRNRMKIVARDVHDYMLGLGDGYALVTPPDETRDWSLVTAESPLYAITGHDPATGIAKAGLKVFHDEAEKADLAFLYIPGDVPDAGMWVARMQDQSFFGTRGMFRFSDAWQWDQSLDDDLPDGRMPLIRFRNYRGISEFEEHLDHLDRINDKIFNEWWVEKIQAFRQRAIQRGKDAADDDDFDDSEDGVTSNGPTSPALSPEDLADMFVSSPDALWDLPPGATMWESTPVQVDGLLNSIQKELQWLAGAADKPLSSLNPDAANQSAAGSTNQKEEHLYQVEDRRDRAEAGWAEVMATAFAYQGDQERSDVSQIEALWGPLERFTLEEKAQAASQANTSLPREAIQRDIWQYDPAEIPNLRTMTGRDLLFQAPGQPPQNRPTPPAAQK